MSRVAKNPVAIPDKVDVALTAASIAVSGPLGKFEYPLSADVKVERDGNVITFAAANESQQARAMSGTVRALVANMVHGVSQGFTRKLTLVGVGFRAAAQGQVLDMELGYSHPIKHTMPAGVTVQTPTPTEVVLSGPDKQVVGQIAAQIRAYRAPEPYKGKGVRYSDEVVVIKETKKK